MDGFFGLDNASVKDGDLELIATVYDNVRKSIVESLLRDAGIPCVIKERGAGGVTNIIMGFSIYGADIYVEKERLEEADAVLAPLFADDEANDSDISEDELSEYDCDVELDEESDDE